MPHAKETGNSKTHALVDRSTELVDRRSPVIVKTVGPQGSPLVTKILYEPGSDTKPAPPQPQQPSRSDEGGKLTKRQNRFTGILLRDSERSLLTSGGLAVELFASANPDQANLPKERGLTSSKFGNFYGRAVVVYGTQVGDRIVGASLGERGAVSTKVTKSGKKDEFAALQE